MFWDYFATCIRIILVLLVPLEISFETAILFHSAQALTEFIIVTIVLDIVVRINTVYYLNGVAIVDRWETLKIQLRESIYYDVMTILVLIIFLAQAGWPYLLLLTFSQYIHIYQVFGSLDQITTLSRPQRGLIGLFKLISTLL